jgi:predicted metal-dependent peptidase
MSTDEKELECLQALAAARAYLILKAPYLSTILYGLVPRVVTNLPEPTMGVTKGMVLYMDPDFMLQLGDDEVTETMTHSQKRKMKTELRGTILAHEVNHILRGIERLEQMENQELANMAFDIPINDDLVAAGFRLPSGKYKGLTSDVFGFPKGLTGEQYYELMKKNMQQVHAFCGKNGHGAGEESAGGAGGQSDDQQDGSSGGGQGSGDGQQQQQGGSGGGQGKDQRQVAAGRCGSCGGSSIDPALEQKLDAEAGRGNADKQRLRKEAIQQIRSEAQLGRGSIPGSLKELLDEKPPMSLIPWRMQVQRVIRRTTGRIVCGQADFSMLRLSKKSLTRGIARPGMVDRKVEIVLVQDTSLSMGTPQLTASRSETVGVFKQLGISEVWYIDADTRVACEPRRIRLRDVESLPFHGRGGTDFRPAIEAIQKLRPRPDLCIYFTDGDGFAPEHPPSAMEVIWCIVPTPNGRRPAPWGHLIVVSDDQQLRDPYGI